MAFVEIVDIVQKRDDRNLLEGIYLEIPRGEVHALIGSTGAGKTTLLRLIALLDKPESGRISIDSIDVSSSEKAKLALRRRMGFVLQKPVVFNASVFDNIAYGLRCRKLPLKEISSKVSAALDWAGIGHLQLRNARDLSGGERQRVAFARARILSPRILLLDEPTANMDREAREQAYRMIRRLKDEGVSILLATHEFHDVAHLCDHHLSLQAGVLRQQPNHLESGERKIIPYG